MAFLQTYREYCQRITDAPWLFHEYVGLATIAAVMANKWKLPGPGGGWIYPNLALVLVAASSRFRKSTSLKISRRILRQVEGKPAELAWRASEEGLIEQLGQHPAGVVYCDELASFAGLLGRDFMGGGKGLWASIFDGELPAEFFKRGQSKPRDDLAVSFLAATTTEWLTEQLKESDIRGGLLPRFLLVPASSKEGSMPRPPIGDPAIEQALAIQLRNMAQASGIMTISKPAEVVYDQWFRRYDTARLDGTRSDPWVPRLATCALKLAMILQLDTNGSRTIDRACMEQACQYAGWAITQIGKLCQEELTFTRFERELKRVREICLAAADWMDYQELLWRSHLKTRELQEILNTAVESGQMTHRQIKREGAKRLVTQYLWNPQRTSR